jgi:hypothetical protein
MDYVEGRGGRSGGSGGIGRCGSDPQATVMIGREIWARRLSSKCEAGFGWRRWPQALLRCGEQYAVVRLAKDDKNGALGVGEVLAHFHHSRCRQCRQESHGALFRDATEDDFVVSFLKRAQSIERVGSCATRQHEIHEFLGGVCERAHERGGSAGSICARVTSRGASKGNVNVRQVAVLWPILSDTASQEAGEDDENQAWTWRAQEGGNVTFYGCCSIRFGGTVIQPQTLRDSIGRKID